MIPDNAAHWLLESDIAKALMPSRKDRLAVLAGMTRSALAIEAQRAETTKIGSVGDESAGRQATPKHGQGHNQ